MRDQYNPCIGEKFTSINQKPSKNPVLLKNRVLEGFLPRLKPLFHILFKTRELVLILSEESKKTLNVVSALTIPNFLSKLQAELSHIKEKKWEFTLTVKVGF